MKRMLGILAGVVSLAAIASAFVWHQKKRFCCDKERAGHCLEN